MTSVFSSLPPWVMKCGRSVAVYFQRTFAMDERSLAAFRIAMGAIMMASSLGGLEEAEFFYSDDGWLPRTSLFQHMESSRQSWSLYFISGSWWWQAALLLLETLAALCYMVGFRTRQAGILAWLLFASRNCRNPIILNGGDTLRCLYLFWSLFIPLSRCWSVDAWLASRGQVPRPGQQSGSGTPQAYLGAGTVALITQIIVIYLCTGLLKNGNDWRVQGTALYYTLQLDHFAKPLGKWLVQYPVACRMLTFATVWLEIGGAILLLIPWARMRFIVISAFVIFHVGISMTMRLGTFQPTMIAGLLSLLPGSFWEHPNALVLTVTGVRKKISVMGMHFRARFNSFRGNSLVLMASRWKLWQHGDPYWRPGRFLGSVCSILTLYSVTWNWRGFDFPTRVRYFPQSVNFIAYNLQLSQHWAMFAPNPFTHDGWVVVWAKLSDGEEIDLWRAGSKSTDQKPQDIAGEYPSCPWAQIAIELTERDGEGYRYGVCNYLVRKWNANHSPDKQVLQWELRFFEEVTPREFQEVRVQKHVLWYWPARKISVPKAKSLKADSPAEREID